MYQTYETESVTSSCMKKLTQINNCPKSNNLLVAKLILESKIISVKALKTSSCYIDYLNRLSLASFPLLSNIPINSTTSKTCKTISYRGNDIDFRIRPTWIQFQLCLLQIRIYTDTHKLPFRCIFSHIYL